MSMFPLPAASTNAVPQPQPASSTCRWTAWSTNLKPPVGPGFCISRVLPLGTLPKFPTVELMGTGIRNAAGLKCI